MNWIRIATGIMQDPSIHAVADATGVSVPTTTGHVVGVLTYLPEHARGGDLSGVLDATLERWAMWTGKRGRFAAAFRAHLCTAQGVVRSWEKHNGAAIRDSDYDRERKRMKREADKSARRAADVQRMSGGQIPDVRQMSTVDGTGRDGTGRLTTTTNNLGAVQPPLLLTAPVETPKPAKPKKAKAEKAPPNFPNFSKAFCDSGYNVWLEKLGFTNYGVFRNAFGPFFNIPEADRPSAMPRDAEWPDIIRLYAVAIRGTRSAQFTSPERCAAQAIALTAAAREPETERRLYMARTAMGTVEEQRRLEVAA